MWTDRMAAAAARAAGNDACCEHRRYVERLIRTDFARCHPGEDLDDIVRRSRFTKEDRGLLREWLTLGMQRALADEITPAGRA